MLDTKTINDAAQYVIENHTEHDIELPEPVFEESYKGKTLDVAERQLGSKLDVKQDGARKHFITVTGVQLKALARRPLFAALVSRRDIDVRQGRALFAVA